MAAIIDPAPRRGPATPRADRRGAGAHLSARSHRRREPTRPPPRTVAGAGPPGRSGVDGGERGVAAAGTRGRIGHRRPGRAVHRPRPARHAGGGPPGGPGDRDQRQDHHHPAAGRRPRRARPGGHVVGRRQPAARVGRGLGVGGARGAGRARGRRGLPRRGGRRRAPRGGDVAQPVARPTRPGERGPHGGGALAARRSAATPSAVTVVANADDPLVVWAARDAARVVWVAAGQLWRHDAVGCPACDGRIVFADGDWSCACGFRRPRPDAVLRGDVLVTADGRHLPVRPRRCPGAATSPTRPWRRWPPASLGCRRGRRAGGHGVGRRRRGAVRHRGAGERRRVRLLLAKNPAGWAELLDLLEGGTDPVVIGINARIADGHDPSWLWDVRLRAAGRAPGGGHRGAVSRPGRAPALRRGGPPDGARRSRGAGRRRVAPGGVRRQLHRLPGAAPPPRRCRARRRSTARWRRRRHRRPARAAPSARRRRPRRGCPCP